MSTISSKTLINRFPQDRETIERLINIFNDNDGSSRLKEFTIKRIFERTLPRSEIALAQILNYLENTGALQKIIRVESPSQGGLADFTSILDVPDVIHDWRRDIEMRVTPENISVLYKVISDFVDGACIHGH